MHWSEKPITWSRVDHHAVMPNPGSYALVLDPTFASQRLTCRFSRVLVDGDSSIIILYLDTLLKLGLKENSRLADARVINEERRQIDRLVAQATEQPAIPTPPSQSAGEGTFKPAKETKQVPLDPANPKKCVTIGAGLSPK
ncbi:hypothetical protein ZWY2020_033455 [Hordeum vulgare]|nr:hypothetical protein ZWY2020_033455 [Hordeum vulgare]